MRVVSVYILSLSVLVTGAVLTGCSVKAEGKTNDPKTAESAKTTAENAAPAAAAEEEISVIPVQAAKVTRGDISEYFETTTRIVAEKHVEVLAEGIGQCLSVNVEEGDTVKKGQVLAELDRKELEAGLAQATVNVQQTKYQMQKAKEQFEKGILSSFEAENARFMHEQAAAGLKVQQVRIEKQSIIAPIDGVVTKRNLQRGQMVAGGVPAFSIVDPASFILPINPPEKELPRLSVGQLAKVTIDSNSGKEIDAHLRRINPSVDPLSGTIKVTLDFSAEDRALLREAAFVRVRLIMSTHENALLVPKDVMVEENARRYLLVLNEAPSKDGKPRYSAERREVVTGLEDANRVEIKEGADDNTLIVTMGQQTLKAGSIVTITSTNEEITASEHTTAADALAIADQKEADKKKAGADGKPLKKSVGGGVRRDQLK